MKDRSDSLAQIYRQLYEILNRPERCQALLVFILTTIVAMVEVVGVASIMPFMAVLANQGMIHSNRLLSIAYTFLDFKSDQSFLVALGAALFVFLVGSMALKAFSFWAQMKFSNERVHSLSYRLFLGYLSQPYPWFLQRHTSTLANKMLTEVNEAVHGALFPATQVIANGLATLFLLALIVLIDPVLAAGAAASLSIIYGLTVLLTRKRLDVLGERRTTANMARFHVVQEALGGIKEVKIGGLERVFLERFRGPSLEVARTNTKAKVIGEMPSFAMQAAIFGGLLIVLLYFLVFKGGIVGALPILAVYAFAGYRLIPSLQTIYNQLSAVRFHSQQLRMLHDELRQMAALPALDFTQGQKRPKRRFARSVELVDVHYTYPGAQKQAAAGLTLSVPYRSRVGIVGSSGSGKTTAIDMILGLLQPDQGQLQVDGVALGAEEFSSWQGNVGYVPQHIYLTDDSIAGNIAFGVPESQRDMAAIERAARVANLHDFILRELPAGYDTQVGERGVRLSGGQRQRIGIARALYHDPEILILDEATSALDSLTERAVMEAMANIGGHKTILLIAHRLTTVKSCDRIYLLEGGRAVASGTFQELVDGNDHFRAMAGM